MSSLWPDFSTMKKVKLPKDILSEQAKYLSTATNGRVYAQIKEVEVYNEYGLKSLDNKFRYSFEIRSKYSKNYKFELLSIIYPMSFYPLEVKIGDRIAKDIDGDCDLEEIELEIRKDKTEGGFLIKNISDLNEFEIALKVIFNSDVTREIIGNILSIE